MPASLGRFASVFLCLLVLAVPSSARAEPSRAPTSYSSEVLIADGASLGLVAAGAGLGAAEGGTRSSAVTGLLGAGVLGYVLAAPIMHFRHGRVGVGILDLAARLTLPAAALALDTSSPIPILVSVGAISTVDAGWLARPSDTSTPYRNGMPLEDGDRLESRPNWTMAAIGGGAFLLGYGAFQAMPCSDDCSLMRVPVAPPFILAARAIASDWDCPKDAPAPCFLYPTAKGLGVAMAITDGVLQAGGLGLLAAAFILPEKRVVHASPPAVAIRPVLSPTNVGIAGTF